MKTIAFSTFIPNKEVQEVFKQFDQELFQFLSPPLIPTQILRFDGCKIGDEIHLLLGIRPLSSTWVSIITKNYESETKSFFVDEGKKLPPPLQSWEHLHSIEKASLQNVPQKEKNALTENEGVIISDFIQYQCTSSGFDRVMYPFFHWMFQRRIQLYKDYFAIKRE